MRRPKLNPGQPLKAKLSPSDVMRFLAMCEECDGPTVRGCNCWRWTGAADAKGYGQFKLAGKARWAHRVAYELFRSRIRFGQDVDRICHNRSCVNPRHLRATSREINSSRQPARSSDIPF